MWHVLHQSLVMYRMGIILIVLSRHASASHDFGITLVRLHNELLHHRPLLAICFCSYLNRYFVGENWNQEAAFYQEIKFLRHRFQ